MRNWKELGEVPDSDDESFDSPDSHHEIRHEQLVDLEHVDSQNERKQSLDKIQLDSTAKDVWELPSSEEGNRNDAPRTITSRKTASADPLIPNPSLNDIWDIPPSSEAGAEQDPFHKSGRETPPPNDFDGPPFSPLSPVPDDDAGNDGIDELGIIPSAPAAFGVRDGTTRHNGTTSVARPPVTFAEDEISMPYVTITAPLPGRSISSRGPAKQSSQPNTPASRHSGVSSLEIPLYTTSGRSPSPVLVEAPPRGTRSLRPRKPIQQHPYLLESVQYAHAMKSHGVKPIRVLATEVSDTTQIEGGGSQDRDFEEESSQELAIDQSVDDGSQPLLFDDMDEDLDVLVPSPSPPRTSPQNMLQTSSQRSEADGTDNTSVLEDDFPSIEELVRRPPKPKAPTLKRQLSSKLLPQSKRLNRIPTRSAELSSPPVSREPDIWSLPPSSPWARGLSVPSQDLGSTPRFPDAPRTETSASSAVLPHSDLPSSRLRAAVVDLTNQTGEDDASDSEASLSASSSKSGSEVIRRNVKRIRGVLPASWLRIDQQKIHEAKRKTRRTPEPSLAPAPPRRGVAIRKSSSPKPSTSTLRPLFLDYSDDDEVTTIRPISERRQSSPDESPPVLWSDHDDAGSAIEEDLIDRMFNGTKRNRSPADTLSTAKRRKVQQGNAAKGQAGVARYQPRITDVLGRTKSKTSTAAKTSTGTKEKRSRSDKSSRTKKPVGRDVTPPLLSVLDVLDKQAPPFLKIAARTAKRRRDLGKSSPTHKRIDLGTRKDNVDALSVLRDWKSGRIRSKTSRSQGKKTLGREPLQSLSTNTSPTLSRDPRHVQRSKSGGHNLDLVSRGNDNDQGHVKPRSSLTKTSSAANAHSWSARPAQLETEENDRPDRVGFHARKRALDALFRNTRKATSTSSVSFRLEQQWDSIRLANAEDEQPSEPTIDQGPGNHSSPRTRNVKSRFRKRVIPKPVDLQAAHFIHANDPLPPEEVTGEQPEERQSEDKLYGLATYGTKYTYHFEIFPLDRGTYFHSTSLIGCGWIAKVNDPLYPERTKQARPKCSFSMDGKQLRWGPWDETVSSELGILVDWVAEQLLSPLAVEGDTQSTKSQEAAAFLLNYAVNAISFLDEDAERSFISRIVEVFDGLLKRIDEARALPSALARSRGDALIGVLTYSTLIMHAVHRISGSSMSLRIQVETMLTRTAKSCITSLLGRGLEDLRALFGDLQRLSARERGIRSDCVSANPWVVLMRVLENARIPRSSFWDVTHSVVAGSSGTSGSDARVFENLWRDMFTLLPLTEVDDFGVVRPGTRHTTPIEGWTLPQKLLKRIAYLYKQNQRQPPSFNEYCRALAARCHYLVQEWGWRKCAGIIGTWFDFFTDHNLSHLRNEEVYKSPRFLEELSGSPSLAIDPEDRCFHIFLKILALVIQRWKKLGLTNDIKNLVARTLPNRDRQYLKEDTVHQRDLAALRNHHDLLCTLFWASPPELRPGVRLIEELIVPGSSHKEACLINIRAWSQLARFVVSSGEGSAVFRPFISWQNNIFQQVMDQYLSAASDIQQQVLALPKDGPKIGEDVVDSMVKQNRAVAMDMLFVSVKASFEVLKLAGPINVATYALNIYQLQQVFTRFNYASRDFDWTIVNLALDMLEHYVSRVEKAAELQYSSDSTDMTDSQDLEEATLLLDHNLAEKLFSLGRTMLGLHAAEDGVPRELVRCTEKIVKLSARVACRFIHSGFTRTANYFTSGKYGLFRESPLKLYSPQRKFLPLFVATLIKNHVYDFKDVGATLFQLWMVSLVKPYRALAYENHLAEILKQRNLPYLQQVAVLPGTAPDYLSNLDLFTCGVSHMRKALREADSTHGRQLRDEYAKTLHSAMQKMKDDLTVLRPDPVEHRQYMDFVRRVIGLIKSHGVGICVVDSFFTQPSSDYSPPMEDPQLHTAGIIAYGVRLGEGDTMAVSQLFYYLFNNFKIALINDKLEEEAKILESAMSNGHVFSFVLTHALPAIIWATSKIYEAWPLLDVYLAAMRSLLTRSILAKEIRGDNLVHVSALLSGILTWFRTLRCTGQTGLTRVQLHIMAQLMDLAVILQPSLIAHLYSEPESHVGELQQSYTSMVRFAEDASEHLDEVLGHAHRKTRYYTSATGNDYVEQTGEAGTQAALNRVQISSLCRGIPDFDWGPVFQSGRELDPQVDSFANEIVRDMRKNWVVTATSISLNTPARGPSMSSTQSGPGTRYELLGVDALFGKLRDRLRCWTPGGSDGFTGNGRRRKGRMRWTDEPLF